MTQMIIIYIDLHTYIHTYLHNILLLNIMNNIALIIRLLIKILFRQYENNKTTHGAKESNITIQFTYRST